MSKLFGGEITNYHYSCTESGWVMVGAKNTEPEEI